MTFGLFYFKKYTNMQDNYRYSAAIEWFHAKIMELFHEKRLKETPDETSLSLTGTDLNNIIASAKLLVYDKHRELKQPNFKIHSVEIKEHFIYILAKKNDTLRFCTVASSLKEAWEKMGINTNEKDWELSAKIELDRFSLLYKSFEDYISSK